MRVQKNQVRYKKRRFKRLRSRYHLRAHHESSMEDYATRNALLLEIGFKDYKAYLRSSLWKTIRSRKLEQDPACYVCERGSDIALLQIHHSRYTRDNLAGNTLEHLWTLCSRCHKWCEITKNGYKRNPESATREMFSIRKQFLANHSSI